MVDNTAVDRRLFVDRVAQDVIAAESADQFTRSVAAIIDPVHFACTPEMYGTDEAGFRRTFAYGAQLVAITKAIKVIAMVRDAARATLNEEAGK